MFYCSFCGYQSSAKNANFCATCGPDGPSAGWQPHEVDDRKNLERFASIFASFPVENAAGLMRRTNELREKLKISHEAWLNVKEHFEIYKNAEDKQWPIRVRFRYDEEKTFAHEDALLEFELSNVTSSQYFSASITWDDPETERIDLHVSTKKFVAPASLANLSAPVNFDRPGQKDISELVITISDETGSERKFRADGFKIHVKNPSMSVQNVINNTNTISIEGRGVVDANGFGSNATTNAKPTSDQTLQWIPITINPMIDFGALAESLVSQKTHSAPKDISDNRTKKQSLESTQPSVEASNSDEYYEAPETGVPPSDSYDVKDNEAFTRAALKDNSLETPASGSARRKEAEQEPAQNNKSRKWLLVVILALIAVGPVNLIVNPAFSVGDIRVFFGGER